ncbi:hypothetical protein DPEC_G00309410 [Dallia pectoralis]|uniref:Uncharacterized protein n=1 Tax=Dallia pectoralis TaxID=75939 RepID=A0ACC2FF29_DALPE|nr:hypothetical protein DPEC_G00309410 [Dallia pectoralis]
MRGHRIGGCTGKDSDSTASKKKNSIYCCAKCNLCNLALATTAERRPHGNILRQRQPRSTRVVRRAKQNRLTKKKLRQLPRPSQEGHVVSVKKEVFKTEFDDAELNGEGTIGTFGDFQNEVGTKVLGVGPGNPRTTDLLDDEQTLDNAALSEANRVHPLITRTSQWPSLPTKNLQPRVNLVRLNLEHSSHNTPELIRGFHFSTPQNSPGPHVTAAPTTVQSQGNTPFDVNLPHFVPLSQQATVAQDNQSQAYTSQNNQSQAYTSQSNQAPADVPQSNHSYVRPRISASQVNPTPGHIPQIDIQPHIHVQSPPLDLTALVQIHHQGYNMLQRELVGMRSGIETMLQPLLSSINTNLERLVNAVERLSGVENKLQTDGGVRNQGSSPD